MALDFIVVNDLHLADKPPLGRKDGYREEGLAMLRECVALANEHHCALISTGDLFHIKRGQYVSDWLKREIIAILRTNPLHMVTGNHDMGPAGAASIPYQPLGLLHEAGAVIPLRRLDLPNWALIGRDYDMERDTDPRYFALTPEEKDDARENQAVAVIAHGSIIPPGQQRPYPTVTCTDIDMTGINLLCSGHIHEDLGIYPTQEKPKGPIKIFANLGALGRCSRTEANMTRTIKALGVKLQGQEIQLHELPLKSALPAADIFVEHVVSDIDSEAITEVVAAMAHTELGLEGADFATIVKGLGLEQELEDRLLRYLEDADAES